MATYVNDLRLKEIATGDESGTWGTSTNTNLELIADAFSYATKDCFATDADATETMADGVADEIRSLYLKVTSSATLTATRTLTLAPNTVSKTWIIENATTGGQSISISQGSGANVTIPNGDTKIIYTDGAGAGAAVTDAFANLKVTDPAQTNITSVGTLTGLDIAGTATMDGLTVDGGSGNSLVNFTPSGTFSTVVSFANAASAFDIVSYGSGSASADNFRIRDNGVSRLNIAGNGDISFYDDTGTSQALFWDASAEGLGLGTTSPSNSLHVASADATVAHFQHTDGINSNIRISDTSDSFYLVSRDGIGSIGGVNSSSGSNLNIDLTSGNVGIGTSSPSQKLTVSTTSASQAILISTTSANSDSGIGFTNDARSWSLANRGGLSDSLVIRDVTAGADRVVVDSSGNLLINGTSKITGYAAKFVTLSMQPDPSQECCPILELVGNRTASPGNQNGMIQFWNKTSTAVEVGRISSLQGSATNSGAFKFQIANAGTLSEAMRIDSSGNLLVGQTSGSSTDTGHILNPNGVAFHVRDGGICLVLDRLTSDGDIQTFRKDGTIVGSIGTQFGRLTVGSNSAAGVRFDGTSLVPMNGASISDNTIILGDAGYRFKDLYLSGQISTNSTGGLSITADSVNRGILNLSTSTAYQLIGGSYYGYTGYKTGGYHRFFGSDGSEDMRLTSSGNLLINSTSVLDAKLVSQGSGTTSGGYSIVCANSAGGTAFFARNDGVINTGVLTNSPYNLTIGSAANCVINSDGTLYRSTSSRRYKNTITDATHGLTELLTLRPVTYKGNGDADGDTVYGGLIAEEVHDAGLTEFVVYNEEGEPDALAYSNMVSLCIKAIQEQQTIIESLEARITALES